MNIERMEVWSYFPYPVLLFFVSALWQHLGKKYISRLSDSEAVGCSFDASRFSIAWLAALNPIFLRRLTYDRTYWLFHRNRKSDNIKIAENMKRIEVRKEWETLCKTRVRKIPNPKTGHVPILLCCHQNIRKAGIKWYWSSFPMNTATFWESLGDIIYSELKENIQAGTCVDSHSSAVIRMTAKEWVSTTKKIRRLGWKCLKKIWKTENRGKKRIQNWNSRINQISLYRVVDVIPCQIGHRRVYK